MQEIGGDTAEFMGHLIKLRADRMAINITVNSIGTPLNEVRPVDGCLYLYVCASAFAFRTIYIHIHNPPPPTPTPTPNIHTPQTQPSMRSTRQKLFPAVGYLYPAGSQKLADVTDESQIEGALSAVPEYQKLYNSISVRGLGLWV